MGNIDFSRLDRTGIDSVMFAIRKMLEECEGREFHLKTETFCKLVKGKDICDPTYKPTPAEKRQYKRQLARVLKYWDEYNLSDEWEVNDSNGKEFKLVFRRDSI